MGDRKIFEGIFDDFEQVPGRTNYNNEVYIDGLAKYCKARVEELLAGEYPAPVERNQQSNLLIAVVGMLLSARKPVHVVDFGGGLGQTFVTVAAALGSSLSQLHYTILDLPDTIEHLRRNNIYQLSGIAALEFSDSAEALSDEQAVDIFYMGSTLQYVDDFRRLFSRIFEIAPEYLLINQTPMVLDAPTFVTAQVGIPGRVLAVRIFNVDHLVTEMRAGGYELVVRSCEAKAPGVNRFFNFPSEYRNERSAILLFRRMRGPDSASLRRRMSWMRRWARLFGKK